MYVDGDLGFLRPPAVAVLGTAPPVFVEGLTEPDKRLSPVAQVESHRENDVLSF